MKESDGLTAKGEHVYFVTKTPEELKNESSRADRLALMKTRVCRRKKWKS